MGILRSECDGTRWRTGGEVKGKLANGVGIQYSHTTSQRGVSSITNADAHTSAASSRLNWLRRFKWTRPFRRKTKCGFCACAIRFRASSNYITWYRCGRRRWDIRNAAAAKTISYSLLPLILASAAQNHIFFYTTLFWTGTFLGLGSEANNTASTVRCCIIPWDTTLYHPLLHIPRPK